MQIELTVKTLQTLQFTTNFLFENENNLFLHDFFIPLYCLRFILKTPWYVYVYIYI